MVIIGSADDRAKRICKLVCKCASEDRSAAARSQNEHGAKPEDAKHTRAARNMICVRSANDKRPTVEEKSLTVGLFFLRFY